MGVDDDSYYYLTSCIPEDGQSDACLKCRATTPEDRVSRTVHVSIDV